MKATVAGYYKIVARNKDTNQERILADWFPNLITNNGLNMLNVGNNNAFGHCYVGSGNNPPLPTNSTLQSFVAAVAGGHGITETAQSTAPYYGKAVRSFTFNPGGAVGNLSEVGVGNGLAGTNLFSRALIADAEGNPITITVLPDDYLTVLYELRLYPPEGITTATVTIAGVETEVTVQAINLTNTNAWMPMQNAAYNNNICCNQAANVSLFNPAGNGIGSVSYSSISSVGLYVADNLYRDARISLGLNEANSATGIGAMNISTWVGQYKVTFNPPIVKDNTRTFSLDYRVAWGRYTP